MTQLEITTSTLSEGSGISSMMPLSRLVVRCPGPVKRFWHSGRSPGPVTARHWLEQYSSLFFLSISLLAVKNPEFTHRSLGSALRDGAVPIKRIEHQTGQTQDVVNARDGAVRFVCYSILRHNSPRGDATATSATRLGILARHETWVFFGPVLFFKCNG